LAELDSPILIWTKNREDPAYQKVDLPAPLPEIGDNFDWQQRDFDSFRLAMENELQDRFPERKRWTSGDVEAVLVEALAALLDQLSDMADRVSAEAYLETSRRSESVLKWLDFIGYDPLEYRPELGSKRAVALEKLIRLYREKPHEMERDRLRGPASIRRQRRMVSPDDYGVRLEEHPLVMRAQTTPLWNGSWLELHITVGLWKDWRLDNHLMDNHHQLPEKRKKEVIDFHIQHRLRMPRLEDSTGTPALLDNQPTIRELLKDYIKSFRMTGQPVLLKDVIPVGLFIGVCVSVRHNYFQSEVRREVERALGRGPTGFFKPGRLAFGQDIQLSDIYESLMVLDGIENVVLERFGKNVTDADHIKDGQAPQRIEMAADELAVCNLKGRGRLKIRLCGGRRG
jgi:hypothetical protein